MPDIFLYPGETSPNDIRLNDPASASIVGAGAWNNSTDVGAQVATGARKVAAALLITASAGLFLPPTAPPLAAAGIPINAGGAAPRARQVYYQARFEPPAVSIAGAPAYGWWNPLSTPPPVVKAQQGFASVPFNTAQLSVNFTPLGWQPPTSIAPPVVKAQAGFSSVPFNTAQLSVNFTILGWQPPTATAPPVAKAQVGFASVPFDTAQQAVAIYTILGWQQPLSAAAPTAKPLPGFSSVPLDTVPQPTSPDIGIPLDMGGASPRVRNVYYQARFAPPDLLQQDVVTAAYGWWNSLSTPPLVARAPFAQWQFPYSVVAGVALDQWQQPLSVAPFVAKAQQGFATVPFNTAQTAVGIAGMAWFTPLWTVPTRILTAPQGNSLVPFNTTQTVTTPGRRKPLLFISNVGRLMN